MTARFRLALHAGPLAVSLFTAKLAFAADGAPDTGAAAWVLTPSALVLFMTG